MADNLKIGIWVGCANGGMMDSMSIEKFEPGDGVPEWVATVTPETWKKWQKHLKEHAHWEKFWDSQCVKVNEYKEDDNG